MLFYDDLDNIVFTKNQLLPSDEFVIISGYVGPTPLKQLKSLGLKTTVVYGMYACSGISSALKQAMINAEKDDSNLSIRCSQIPVHAKCYIWKNQGKVVGALVGSANFSENGLKTPYKEVLADTTVDTFKPLNDYIEKVLNNSIACDDATIKIIKHKKSKSSEVFTNPDVCPMSLLIKNKGKLVVPSGSGINWGFAEGSHVAKNDAYIPISAEMVRRYPVLFPKKQNAPTNWDTVKRKDHRDNDCIDIIWDDGTTMSGLLEGSRSVGGLDGKYPKQLSSSPSKSEIGRYLRKRLGLKEDSFVTLEDLNRYGRSSIDISLIGEGIYYLDFSV